MNWLTLALQVKEAEIAYGAIMAETVPEDEQSKAIWKQCVEIRRERLQIAVESLYLAARQRLEEIHVLPPEKTCGHIAETWRSGA